MMKPALIALLVLALGGCAVEREPIGPAAEAAAIVARADWSRAEAIEVNLDEFDFAPASLVLRKERPDRLHLENLGGLRHSFTAPGLFGAVALRDDPAAAAALGAGGVVELGAGESVDLYLVPLAPGAFAFECSEPLHKPVFGMGGEIVVE
jgi:uncharacterized cupredoxin-like copper-binding protein